MPRPMLMSGNRYFRRYFTWFYIAALIIAALITCDSLFRKEFTIEYPELDTAHLSTSTTYHLEQVVSEIDAYAQDHGHKMTTSHARVEVYGHKYFYRFYVDAEISHGIVRPTHGLGSVSYLYWFMFGEPDTSFVYDISARHLDIQ